MVDGEVVADEEEVAELDLLLPQQALTPRDLPHLGQDLKPITISITIVRVNHDEPAQRQCAWPPH